jgi:hypothetical protein
VDAPLIGSEQPVFSTNVTEIPINDIYKNGTSLEKSRRLIHNSRGNKGTDLQCASLKLLKRFKPMRPINRQTEP